jgi:hypothetical protein
VLVSYQLLPSMLNDVAQVFPNVLDNVLTLSTIY